MSESKKNIRSITILVIDDEYSTNDDISNHLKSIGYNVISAFSAHDFVNNIGKSDIILLDIRLPDNDASEINIWGGLEMFKKIFEEYTDENRPKCLSRVIIRSVISKKEAKKSHIDIPECKYWLHTSTPLSHLIDAIQFYSNELKKD